MYLMWCEINHIIIIIIIIIIGVVTGGATGGMVPSLSAKIILKIFPFFLNTILHSQRKTIRQDEESTNLRKNPS